MKLSRALILSIIITFALTLLLRLVFGTMAFGLFLFLPLGFLFARHGADRKPRSDGHHRSAGTDPTPIEPS